MAWMKELTHNAMTKIMSAEIWVSVLLSMSVTAFGVGVAYAYLEKDIEANQRSIHQTRLTVTTNAEETKSELKAVNVELGEIKELMAELAATQRIQTEVQNSRGKRQDDELRTIREILEKRR